jgi:hypothetical protein
MHIRSVVALGYVAIALPLASATAQNPTQPAKWSLSVGVDPTHLDLHTPTQGVDARMVANLTRSWQSVGSRFGRHVSLMLGADAPIETGPMLGCNCSPTRISRSYAALTAGAFVDLFRVSRFTPYLSGGTGAYYTMYGRDPASGYPLTPLEALSYRNGSSLSQLSLGVNGAVGIKARIGSHEFFIEQAVHTFDVRYMGSGVYPLNIGFRF